MPGLDGYEACRQILESSRGRCISMVALSGWGRYEDRARALAAGFTNVLLKPAGIAELLGSIVSSLPRHHDDTVAAN